MEDVKVTRLIDKLSNNNIKVASYKPSDSPFVSMGRRIKILAPPEAVEVVSLGKEAAPLLLQFMADEHKDWAINMILYCIFEREEVSRISSFINRQDEWRTNMKHDDVAFWKQKISET